VLVLQLALALILKLTGASYRPVEPTANLFTCDFNSITNITIEDSRQGTNKEAVKLVLAKDKHSWVLPNYHNSPANPHSIDRFLAMLKSVKKGFPVATTFGAAQHFKVSPDNFEHLISLSSGDQKLAAVYLGMSTGLRTTYARLSNSNDIYSVEIPGYTIRATPAAWLDQNIEQASPGHASRW
jgi:hypothetical protein